MVTNQEKFFATSKEQSQVKATIVAKYFSAWSKVVVPWAKGSAGKIAYIDLFAGPGRYEDGTVSTPLKILQQAIADSTLREMLVTVFNDVDANHSQTLRDEIGKLPGVDTLKFSPVVHNEAVGEHLVKRFETHRLVPTLFFVDPWGYKGLSLKLVGSVLKDWGCDCIFFFNYNRISMGMTNDCVKIHMDALFGSERSNHVRASLEKICDPNERELLIVEKLSQALSDFGGKYVLPFRFRNDGGTRTSHHLVFVSKHARGYTIMKDIMAKESSCRDQGVPSFEYNPADIKYPLLFELSRPLDELGNRLLHEFAGETLTMGEVFDRHHVGKRFVSTNYKDALGALEAQGKIQVNPPADKRRKKGGKVTFSDKAMVSFPKRSP